MASNGGIVPPEVRQGLDAIESIRRVLQDKYQDALEPIYPAKSFRDLDFLRNLIADLAEAQRV